MPASQDLPTRSLKSGSHSGPGNELIVGRDRNFNDAIFRLLALIMVRHQEDEACQCCKRGKTARFLIGRQANR